MKIYKSCTAGLTNKQFEETRCSGTTVFMSFERMMTTSIKAGINLKQNERIVGMVISEDGIDFHLEKI